ncbi:unnamed protein product, partial [Allacma fusca]
MHSSCMVDVARTGAIYAGKKNAGEKLFASIAAPPDPDIYLDVVVATNIYDGMCRGWGNFCNLWQLVSRESSGMLEDSWMVMGYGIVCHPLFLIVCCCVGESGL